MPIAGQSTRFYDGGTPNSAPIRTDPPVIALSRTLTEKPQDFRMTRRIAYDDRFHGEILVPENLETFETDLTSVPALFTWLVPKTGTHLPAALLHDGLVYSPDEPASYISTQGVDIDRVEANRIFRDAMADTGTGTIRRWLMWSAVTTATMVGGVGTAWTPLQRWRYRLAAVGTVLLIALLGVAATLDLFDKTVAFIPGLPWMGDQGFVAELVGGAAAAVVIPLIAAAAWGRFWIAGAVIGISLALLLHVTVAILGLTMLYQRAEKLTRKAPAVALGLAVLLVAISAVIFVMAL